MVVLDRNYTGMKFKYEGDLKRELGAHPRLSVKINILDKDDSVILLHFVFDYSYNNFDGSVDFILDAKTKLDLQGDTISEMEVYDEATLINKDFHKLLIMECTQIRKNVVPPPVDLDENKDIIMRAIREAINF